MGLTNEEIKAVVINQNKINLAQAIQLLAFTRHGDPYKIIHTEEYTNYYDSDEAFENRKNGIDDR